MTTLAEPFNKQIWGFSPQSIPGLSLWLDAADASSVTLSPGTSNVTAWNDKSGNARNTTGVSGNPTYSSNLQNGRNGILIGNSAGFTLPSFILSSTSKVSAFIVANQLTTVGSGNLDLLVSSRYENFTVGFENSLNTFQTFINNLTPSLTAYNNTINKVGIYSVVYDGSAGTRFVTGTAYPPVQTQAPGTALNTAQTFSIGKNTSCNLQYFECILFSIDLTTSQRQQIEGYLAWKWGLQANLPAGHPYLPTASIRAGPYLKAFNPLDIPNCCMWYDGADKSSMTINGSNQITQWNDKSGNGYNLTTTTTTGPTITTSSNAVGYDISFIRGSNNYIARLTGSNFITTTEFTYFTVIINNDDAGQYGRLVSATSPADTSDNTDNYRFTIANAGDSDGKIYLTRPGASGAINPSLTKAQYHIICAVFTSAPLCTLYVDGISVGTSTPSTNTFNIAYFSLGRAVGGGNPLTGVINESISFTSALTDSQRQQMEGYLAWKWGLQRATPSIPTTHPFYNFPSATVTP